MEPLIQEIAGVLEVEWEGPPSSAGEKEAFVPSTQELFLERIPEGLRASDS